MKSRDKSQYGLSWNRKLYTIKFTIMDIVMNKKEKSNTISDNKKISATTVNRINLLFAPALEVEFIDYYLKG